MKECSKEGCNNTQRANNQIYCKECHAESMRINRSKHSELSEEQKKKANARSYLNVYIKRGKIQKESCSNCGEPVAEAHHEDYNKPLDVIWLCRICHLNYHKEL